MKIKVEQYNSEWIDQFKQIRQELSSILHFLHPRIEHFGSTSVPNLAAKPIIDILVGLDRTADLDRTIEPLVENHFIYFEVYNSMPERRFFVRLKDKNESSRFQKIYSHADNIPHEELHKCKLAHIHIWKYGTSEWTRHIAFRDYLRAHPQSRREYARIKKELSLKEWKDGNAYNEGKSNFIKAEEIKAIAWCNKKTKAEPGT